MEGLSSLLPKAKTVFPLSGIECSMGKVCENCPHAAICPAAGSGLENVIGYAS